MADGDRILVTTASDGSATGYLPATGSFTGPVLGITYTKVDYADTVDFTITAEATSKAPAENLWVEANVTATKAVYPSVETHDTVGVAAAASDYLFLLNQRIKIVLASGGDTKTGYFSCKIG